MSTTMQIFVSIAIVWAFAFGVVIGYVAAQPKGGA